MSRATNLSLKSRLLNDKTYYFYTQFLRARYFASKDFDDEFQLYISQVNLEAAKDNLSAITPEELDACKQIYDSSRKKVKTLKHKLRIWMREGYVYFLTLTFSDEVFAGTSQKTRRDYVFRFLSSLDAYYAANIDFGSVNGREHYHAIIAVGDYLDSSISKTEDGKPFERFAIQSAWENKCGFLYVQGPILADEDSSAGAKLARYLAKLSNHALKASALTSNIIYSRKGPSWAKDFNVYEHARI